LRRVGAIIGRVADPKGTEPRLPDFLRPTIYMKRDHAKLICDVGELTGLFHDSPGMEEFLQKITVMITAHMECEVCSIYLFYPQKNELILKATQGLHPSSINNVTMKLGEGLTGQSLKEHRPICEGQAKNNPNFRFFPGIGEEHFESFLAVPIVRGNVEIGVMVVQSSRKNDFNSEDIQIMRAITAQLATTIETARLLMTLNETKSAQPKTTISIEDLKFIQGRSGAAGVAYGKPAMIDSDAIDLERFSVTGKKLTKEDFIRALEKSEQQLQGLEENIEATMYDVAALIFTAQMLMLKDNGFTDAMLVRIEQGADATDAVRDVVADYARKFETISDGYLRDKIYDVKDVGRRILENLTGLTDQQEYVYDRVVIARELFPSDALKLFTQKAKGLILLSGGVSSHVAILARSLNMPLVVVQEPRLMSLAQDTQVLLDAVMGHIHINPTDEIVKRVLERELLSKNIDHLKSTVSANPKTNDGVPVQLLANINLLGDLKSACEFMAHGVGLYRSEFPFMIRSSFPLEEEQMLIYKRLIEGMPGKQINFRTLDIGGDKALSYFNYTHEENPFLGLRSIRFSLKHRDVFSTQIRAILRAGKGHDVRIFFPMISSIDEFLEAKGIVRSCAQELSKENLPHMKNPSIGMMIELPSALEIIDELAEEADFFSIGTNDLVQYLLAVDRTNEMVADLYLPHHPAVLRALKKIVDAAKKHNKDVCICGDMAHDPKMLPVLLGLGLRKFSMDTRYLPTINQILSSTSMARCETLAKDILKESKITRTAQLLAEFAQ
jgi:phosphotransferase system enzyme I (PtsP)